VCAGCCSVFRCVRLLLCAAVCCSVYQCCCDVGKCVSYEMRSGVLQCVVVCCSVLQCVAVCGSVWQQCSRVCVCVYVYRRIYCRTQYLCSHLSNSLQHTATHCSTLQHTATYCNKLQRYSIQYVHAHLSSAHFHAHTSLQHTASHFTTLCHTAILQHTNT